jgi:hypothetical protein
MEDSSNADNDRIEAFRMLKAKPQHASRQADNRQFVDPDEILKKIDILKSRHLSKLA